MAPTAFPTAKSRLLPWNREFWRGPGIWVLVLTLVPLVQLFPAPSWAPWLATDTSVGRWVLFGVLAILATLLFVTGRKEERRTEAERTRQFEQIRAAQAAQDDAADRRHQEQLGVQQRNHEELRDLVRAAVEAKQGANEPLAAQIDRVVEAAKAQGHRDTALAGSATLGFFLSETLAEVTSSLEDIGKHPPVTEADQQQAIQRLDRFLSYDDGTHAIQANVQWRQQHRPITRQPWVDPADELPPQPPVPPDDTPSQRGGQ